jgi:hypothetical protein
MCDVPLGHTIVMQGFENLRQHRQDFGIFDSWLKDFEHTLDGTRKTGRQNSIDDYHKLNVYVPPDSHLIDYCVSLLFDIVTIYYILTFK